MSSIRKTKNLVGPRSSNWKGGIGCKASGYNSIYVPNHPRAYHNRILEHTVVMEKYLGRFLKENEVVHHINHNLANEHLNDIVRLRNHLCFTSQFRKFRKKSW